MIDNIIKSITGWSGLTIKINRVINAAILRDKRLSAWEKDFIFSLADKIGNAEDKHEVITLSQKQVTVIERIEDKVSDVLAL